VNVYENIPVIKLFNYGLGFIVVVCLNAILMVALSYSPIPNNFAFYAVIAVLATYYFGYLGLNKLEIGFNGVPLFLGERIEKVTLGEGWVWVLPYPFMSIESIDVRERTLDVLEAIVISSNQVRMRIDTRLMWRVCNPYASLSIGEGVIEDGQHDLVVNTLREKAYQHTDGELMGELETTLGQLIKEAADNNSDRWGIKTVQVFVIKIVPADEKISEAWELRSLEEREKAAEEVELAHVAKRIDSMSNEGKRMSSEIATAVVMEERGKKSPIRKLIIEGDGQNSLIKAAAVVNDGMSQQPGGA